MKTTKILRFLIFAPKINSATGSVEPPPTKLHVQLPKGCQILKAQVSMSTGGVNLWTLGGDDTETEKRFFMACRTGVDLPECILDCVHLLSCNGCHIFEIPEHVLAQFKDVATGF